MKFARELYLGDGLVDPWWIIWDSFEIAAGMDASTLADHIANLDDEIRKRTGQRWNAPPGVVNRNPHPTKPDLDWADVLKVKAAACRRYLDILRVSGRRLTREEFVAGQPIAPQTKGSIQRTREQGQTNAQVGHLFAMKDVFRKATANTPAEVIAWIEAESGTRVRSANSLWEFIADECGGGKDKYRKAAETLTEERGMPPTDWIALIQKYGATDPDGS